MKVKRNAVVTIDYKLKNEEGDLIDSSESNGQLTYLHGFNNIIPGLEEALEGKQAGDVFNASVPPEKGYGVRDENMVFVLPAENFKVGNEEELVPGMEFDTVVDNTSYILTVVEVNGDKIKVDANHPLSGKNLNFEVKIVNIRESYSDELVQGFPMDSE